MSTSIYSWNVNGIRAAAKKGFFKWLESTSPDIILLQEVRAELNQMQPEWLHACGMHSIWHSAQKKGYSGVGIYSKKPFTKDLVITGLGNSDFDAEGRFLALIQDDIAYVSAYFPNSQEKGARLNYKLAFCDSVLKKLQEFEKQGLNVVLGGDYNIAHLPIDLTNPKQNEKNPGYLPEERQWMSKFLAEGFLDTFRLFHEGPEHYTWWSNRFNAREKNIGWRIDYHCASNNLRNRIRNAEIHPSILGSDHCPVSIVLE